MGTGFLYVRREHIEKTWPLTPAAPGLRGDIRKFEEVGTHPAANHLAVAEALVFHETIGGERKAARLRYLRDRWARRLLSRDRVRLHTSLDPGQACAIGNVELVGLDPVQVAAHLWERDRILVTAIKHDEFQGLRVTPNVYTTVGEIDMFAAAIERILAKGLG